MVTARDMVDREHKEEAVTASFALGTQAEGRGRFPYQ